MQTLQGDYLTAYRNLKLTRDANGVLVTIPESGDRPIVWSKWSNSVP